MKGSEDVQETDTQRQKIHAGKLIHMLSHRLKRQNIVPCGEDGLTTMQKHVLKFILLETVSYTHLSERCGRGISDTKINGDRYFAIDGKERLYLQRVFGERCETEKNCSD